MTTTIASENSSGATTYAWYGLPDQSPSTESLNGDLQRTNTFPSPRGTSTMGTTGTSAPGTVDPSFPSGLCSLQTFSSAVTAEWNVNTLQQAFVTPGQDVPVSMYVKPSFGGSLVGLTMQVFNAAGGTIAYLDGPRTTPIAAGQATLISDHFVMPAGAAGATPFLNANPAGVAPTAGQTIAVSSILMGTTGDYFDGTTPTVLHYPVVTPKLVVGYTAAYQTKNVLHQAIGNRSSTATVNGAGLRTGNTTLLFPTEAAKSQAVSVLSSAAVFDLSSTDLDSIDMSFVISGQLVETLDPETLMAWTVAFDWEEID